MTNLVRLDEHRKRSEKKPTEPAPPPQKQYPYMQDFVRDVSPWAFAVTVLVIISLALYAVGEFWGPVAFLIEAIVAGMFLVLTCVDYYKDFLERRRLRRKERTHQQEDPTPPTTPPRAA